MLIIAERFTHFILERYLRSERCEMKPWCGTFTGVLNPVPSTAAAAVSEPRSQQSSRCVQHLPFLSPSQMKFPLFWLFIVGHCPEACQNSRPAKRRISRQNPKAAGRVQLRQHHQSLTGRGGNGQLQKSIPGQSHLSKKPLAPPSLLQLMLARAASAAEGQPTFS